MAEEASRGVTFLSLIRRHRMLLGGVGGTLAVIIGIYGDEARTALDLLWASMGWFSQALPVLGILGLCAATWYVRGVVEQNRRQDRRVINQSFDIRVADFEDDLPGDQTVIGRELRYLERVTHSNTLVVLLPGLGLDANDFRPYMNIAQEHTAALTLFGFNAEEAKDERYRPVGLKTHVELVNGALNHFRRKYPQKKLVLVGFSTGADMIIRLGEFWQTHPSRNPRTYAMVLLDPNINHSSMVVSGAFATMNPSAPFTELIEIARIPQNITEFQNMSEYLHKISKKNLAHIQRHAEDWWDYWEGEEKCDRFLQRVGTLHAMCPRSKVVFSANYDQHFNEIVAGARRQSMGEIFDLLREDHFQLLNERLIAKEVATLVASPSLS